ncbi:hypothetical protein MGH68_02180 [Erysipelothrix sp. D19-032]
MKVWEKDGIKHYKNRVRIREVGFVPRPYIKDEVNEAQSSEVEILTQ